MSVGAILDCSVIPVASAFRRKIFGLTASALIGALAAMHPGAQSALGSDATGEDIAREAEHRNDGFAGERSAFTLVLINAQGDRVERRFTWEIREASAGDQSRIDFEWPATVRGTVLLTHARSDAEDDQWLFLPAAGRVRRISGGQKNGAFMGSEFTYEDLAPPVVSKYTYQRMADDTVDGRPAFRIERRPRAEGSGYTRQIVWLDAAHLGPLAIEFYDRRNQLLKVATYKGYDLFGRYHRAGLVHMENRQTRRASELKAGERQLGVPLDARRFSNQALGQ